MQRTPAYTDRQSGTVNELIRSVAVARAQQVLDNFTGETHKVVKRFFPEGTPPIFKNMIPVKIKIAPGGRTPEYKSPGAAGADIFARLDTPLVIGPGERALVPAGIRLEIPGGYEAQIRPRSGLALKHGITLPNSPGTIDSDYRGEVGIILMNCGTADFTVENGMRIAQMVFSRAYRADFEESETLEDTPRSGGGFGHTGL